MSYDLYVYSFDPQSLQPAQLVEHAEADQMRLTISSESGSEGRGTFWKVTAEANARTLCGGESERASVDCYMSFTPALDEADRADLSLLSGELSRRKRSMIKRCAAKYHVFFDGLPTADGLGLMERVAWHIATLVGGLYEDPQAGEVTAFEPEDPLPSSNRQLTVEEMVGNLGVLVIDWCQRNGYTIPPAFYGQKCDRYVFLITSFSPPKLNARTLWWETQVPKFLANAPAGYTYRAFDFQDGVELIADGDSFKAIGPIPGLPAMRRSRRRRSGG